MSKKPICITRAELYDLVWSEPVSKVASRFYLSDKGLAKKCQRHHIPCPPLGYWAKKRNGHIVHPTPLPNNNDMSLDTVTFWPRSTAQVALPIVKHHLTETQLEKALAFQIPDKVSRYHPIIVRCRKAHRETKRIGSVDRYGRIVFDESVPNVGFKVTPSTFDRASLLLNSIITLFRSLGWTFSLCRRSHYQGQRYGFTHQDEKLCVEIKERVKRKESDNDRRRKKASNTLFTLDFSSLREPSHESTGQLEFSIDIESPGFQKCWKDTGGTLIEHQLVNITQNMSRAFEYSRLKTIEQKKQREIWESEERERKERQRLERIEEQRREQFFNLAQQYETFSTLQRLITAFDQQENKNEELEDWLIWARQVANQVNPLEQQETILTHFRHFDQKKECD